MDMEEMMKAMGLPTGFQSKKSTKPSTQWQESPVVNVLKTADNPVSGPDSIKESLQKPTTNRQESPIQPQLEPAHKVESDFSLENLQEMPLSDFVFLKGHSRALSAMTLDPSGSRLVTGGRDNQLYLWNFSTMDKRLHHFKSFEPIEGNIITDVQFGGSGEKFLLATPELCVRLLDRDGEELCSFMKGDPYVRDPRKTLGHTSSITMARWHPIDKNCFYTASLDSTIRIWDVDNRKQQKFVIPIKSKSIGNRTHVSAASVSLDGKWIAGAGLDGHVRIWPFKGPYIMPAKVLENAHTPETAVSSMLFLPNHVHLVTRGMDDSLKLFDIRNFKKPVKEHFSLWNRYECTDVILSPDQKYILTGSSIRKNQDETGKIVLYDRTTFEMVHEVDVGSTSVVRLLWHSRINQIFCGLSNGDCQVFYNPMASAGGIKDALVREPRKRAVDELEYHAGPVEIEAPEEEALFPEEEEDRKIEFIKKKMENLVDPRDLRKPMMPPALETTQGSSKVGSGTSLTEYMMKSIVKDRTVNDDPREAILKYAEEAEKDPYWIAPAYKRNQPVNKLAPFVYEDEDEAKRESKKKRKQ